MNKTYLEMPMTPLGPSLHALVATEPSGAAAGEKKMNVYKYMQRYLNWK